MEESESSEKQPSHILISLQNDLETMVFNRKNTSLKKGLTMLDDSNKKVADEINRGLETRDRLVDVNNDLGRTRDQASEMEENANDLKRLAGRHYKAVGYIFLVLSIIFAIGGIVYVILTKLNKKLEHEQFFYKKFAYHDESIASEAEKVTSNQGSHEALLTDRMLQSRSSDQQLLSHLSEQKIRDIQAKFTDNVVPANFLGKLTSESKAGLSSLETQKLEWQSDNPERNLKDNPIKIVPEPNRLV